MKYKLPKNLDPIITVIAKAEAKKSKRPFSEIYQELANDAINNSLTPHMGKSGDSLNPTHVAAKAAHKAFDSQLYSGLDSFIEKRMPRASVAEKKRAISMIRGGIMQITTALMEIAMGYKGHRSADADLTREDQITDYELPRGFKDYDKPNQDRVMKKVMYAQFARVIVASSVSAFVLPLFNWEKKDMETLINYRFRNLSNFGSLGKPPARMEMANAIRKTIYNKLKPVDWLKLIAATLTQQSAAPSSEESKSTQ